MNKQKISPEKFNDRRPIIEYKDESHKTQIFVLDEGESLPMNSSTNYDHHYQGSGMIEIFHSQMGVNRKESWVNDFEQWDNIDFLVNMGVLHVQEMSYEAVSEAREKFTAQRNKRKPRISTHAE